MTVQASESVKMTSARPPYIGLPCSATPGVPSSTRTSIMLTSSRTAWAGTRAPSKRIVSEPVPLRPSESPQSSRTVNAERGATYRHTRGIPRSSVSGSIACPRK